jgi:hypothetical protein
MLSTHPYGLGYYVREMLIYRPTELNAEKQDEEDGMALTPAGGGGATATLP